MLIQNLKKLEDYPARYPNELDYEARNRGLSIGDIQQLEQNWNNGKEFPTVLRELLFLAGDFCYCLDYSIWENQQEMQVELRDMMQEEGHHFSRPFYIIDNYGGDQFCFVYLDEDQENPNVYQYTTDAINRGRPLDMSLGYTLKRMIEMGVEAVKEGRNPF